jgi:POT family proton-dependent oligopeptide transporter
MSSEHTSKEATFFGHPMGLFYLFFTEMWERFSYYGMRAILVLFLTSETIGDNPGFGWLKADALALYGWYTMLVYVASIPGGILADRYIGQRKAVMLGGLLLCLGHGILAVDALWAFYSGLTLIVLGVGCLKPNISTMVGGLYDKKDNDGRDLGFYIFYMGINLGAFLSALIVGYVGEEIGWHYGFGLAGIGMLAGQIMFVYGQKHLKGVGNLVKKAEGEKDTNLFSGIFKSANSIIMLAIFTIVGLYVIYNYSWSYGALVIGIGFAFAIAAVIYNVSNKIERDRLIVIFLSFLIVMFFWGSFEQAGGLMNLYTEEKTNRMSPLWIMQTIFIIPILIFLYKGVKNKMNNKPYWKHFLGLSALIGVVFILLNKYMFTSNPWEVPTTWFQSLNALFILMLATTVGGFWVWWKKSGRRSTSIFKMAVGIVIMGWGFFFMTAAVGQYDLNGSSGMYWLVLAYLFHTVGELCASPVALSFITKLSPERFVAFMMGFYFAVTGLGNKLAGSLGELSTVVGEYAVFTGIAVFCTIIGILVILIVKPLKRLMHGAEDSNSENDEAEGFELSN